MPETLVKKVLDILNIAAVTVNSSGDIIDVNSPFKTQNVSLDGTIIGKRIIDFLPESDADVLSRLRQAGTEKLTLKFPDSLQPVSAQAINLQGNGKEILFMMLPNSDTEAETLQEQLRVERKLSIFGQLIPGIAHNINNPLSVIIGRLQLVQIKNPQLEEIAAIQNQAITIKNIIDTLTLKYSNVSKTQSSPVVISTLLQNELDFLHSVPLYKHKIQKLLDLDTNTPPVTGIYADFATAIMTIVYFSIDSMARTSHKFFRLSLSVDKTHITIDIADTGTPINAAEPNDVFNQARPVPLECIDGHIIDLKLAKGLLIKYNGIITVTKNSDSGKQFLIKIPYP